MRVLVVDDSRTTRRIIINTLNKLGYTECREAGTGREGLDLLLAAPADLVIADWHLPEMSGLEFARALRAGDATRHLPILLVATAPADHDLAAARHAGVSACLVKPFTVETVKASIARLLKA